MPEKGAHSPGNARFRLLFRRRSADIASVYSRPVGIVGGGAWGLALAAAAARTGTATVLFSRRSQSAANAPLPAGVVGVDSMSEVGRAARLVVLAVPSRVIRAVARELGGDLDGRHLLVHAVRGLEPTTLAPLSQVLRQETPTRRIGALGGPVLEPELRLGRPSVMVAGSLYPEVTEAVSSAFGGPVVRVYATNDLTGVELASALMGCLAVGVGYAQQLGLSAGIMATLITRGVEEAARIAAAAGARERTLLGLAGTGDLLASIGQEERPEVVFGRSLAEGRSVDAARGDAKAFIEAEALIPKVAAWAEERQLPCPIFQGLAERLRTPIPAEVLVQKLMGSPRATLA